MDLIILIVFCDFEKYVIIEFRSSFIKFFAQLCSTFFLFFFLRKYGKERGNFWGQILMRSRSSWALISIVLSSTDFRHISCVKLY